MTTGLRIAAARMLRAVGFGTLLALLVAGPTSAKMTPYFTVEVNPSQPVAGEAIIVVVRTWADEAHTIQAGFGAAAELDGLLVLRPAQGNAADVAVYVHFQALDEFRATVVVPSAGDWMLVAFPDRTGWASPDVPPGYPDTIALVVRAPGVQGTRIVALVGLAAAFVIVGVVVNLVRRARRGRRRSIVDGSFPNGPEPA